MAGSRRIVVEFLGKDASLGKTADQVEGKTSKLGSKLAGFGKVAAAGFGIAAVAAGKFGIDAVGAASDLNETLSKSAVVFGKQAPAMDKWARGAARSVGMSREAALAASAQFGDMFRQLGQGQKQSAGTSKRVVELAADLGSFHNLDTSDVLDKISGAMRGEYDAIQKIIPGLSDTRVKQQALADSGKKSATQLTEQEKAMAALAIITKDGSLASGDFARTSGGLANQQKILKAQFQNVQASIGQKLLPVAVKLATWFNDKLMPAVSRLSTTLTQKLGPTFAMIGRVAKMVLGGMRGDFGGNFAQIRATVVSAVSIIRSLWARFGGTLIAFTRSTFNNLRKVIGGALQVIRGIFQTVSALLRGDWQGVWNGLKNIVSGAWRVIRAVVAQGWNIIKTLFRLAGAAVRGIFGGIWNGLVSLVQAGWRRVSAFIASIPGRIGALGGRFRDAGVGLIRNFVNGLSNAGQFISNIVGHVMTAVKGAINAALGRIESSISFNIDWPGPGSFSFNPSIPRLAQGGVVRARPGGTLALIGEGGHDEAVVPLSGPHAPRLASSGGGHYTIDLRLDGKTIQTLLLREKRRNGGLELGLA